MIDQAVLENRLAALELAVADVKQRLEERTSKSENWIQAIAGSVTDDEAFAEVLAYGREVREADRPRAENSQTA